MKMAKHGPLVFEYSKVTPLIYVGTNMCCQVHFDKSLLKQGIKADISLEDTKVDKPFGVLYYCWLPTRDHTAPTMKQLKIGVDFLKSLIDNKVKVYIHCERGHGRAPTLVAAYLISQGKRLGDAIAFIKAKRPAIHLDKRQIAILQKFKKHITLRGKT